jgi:hypothetical protein
VPARDCPDLRFFARILRLRSQILDLHLKSSEAWRARFAQVAKVQGAKVAKEPHGCPSYRGSDPDLPRLGSTDSPLRLCASTALLDHKEVSPLGFSNAHANLAALNTTRHRGFATRNLNEFRCPRALHETCVRAQILEQFRLFPTSRMPVPFFVIPLLPAIERYVNWLDAYGEKSQDHQDFYAGKLGRAAKSFYYRQPTLGKLAVLPMVVCEAFFPWTRRFYYPRERLPISDAHFAMGFAALHRITGQRRYLERAIHFLEVLESTRCPGFERHGWGYPFDWRTRGALIPRGTPLITTTPYCYEAFTDVFRLDPQERWRTVMRSIADHVLIDYRDVVTGPHSSTCTYFPEFGEKVVNANAYRAFTLLSAWQEFGDDRYKAVADRNLQFVLESQQPDGSWPYAMDGVRPFVDHFHTCFVLKALAKIEKLTGHPGCREAVRRGVKFYVEHLFDEAGLPRPFARAPRLTIYKRELYDCAECINLGVLFRGRFPELDAAVDRTVTEILSRWQLPDGHFRSRKLVLGWDNVPMHRWGGSEMFRSLVMMAELEGTRKG